jgi:hypothetical protein
MILSTGVQQREYRSDRVKGKKAKAVSSRQQLPGGIAICDLGFWRLPRRCALRNDEFE